MSETAPTCECGRQPVAVAAFQRNTSLLIRRIGDMGYDRAADWRCTDCVADMADEVAASARPPSHPDFLPQSSTQERWAPCPVHASQNTNSQPCRECHPTTTPADRAPGTAEGGGDRG